MEFSIPSAWKRFKQFEFLINDLKINKCKYFFIRFCSSPTRFWLCYKQLIKSIFCIWNILNFFYDKYFNYIKTALVWFFELKNITIILQIEIDFVSSHIKTLGRLFPLFLKVIIESLKVKPTKLLFAFECFILT